MMVLALMALWQFHPSVLQTHSHQLLVQRKRTSETLAVCDEPPGVPWRTALCSDESKQSNKSLILIRLGLVETSGEPRTGNDFCMRCLKTTFI